MAVTQKGKIVMGVIGIVVFIVLLRTLMAMGIIATPGIMKALVPKKATLAPNLQDAQVQNVKPVAFPSAAPASINANLVRGEVWAWNAQMGLLYANGGPQTTNGSLMAQHGVNLSISRQDDTSQMQNDLVACAQQIHNGDPACSQGANFVVIMGDGAGQFLAGVNPTLEKLGPDYRAVVIGSLGWSRGEDAFLAPKTVRSNAQNFRNAPMPGSHDSKGQELKGLLVAGVIRDGDWNILLKWAGDNNIKNNPDLKTFDPDAINWVGSDDYLKAAEAYNANYCDDRKVIKDGKFTGDTAHVCVNGVVTWTPGDVNIAKNRGGLVKVVSSKQYRSQMPAAIIGPKKFFSQNRDEITGMLAAAFEAGDQIKAFPEALHRAAKISAAIYNEQTDNNGAYWEKYYKGTTEKDSQGNDIELGGSSVNNMADELIAFGLQGGTDYFRATYTTFADIDNQQYPDLFKKTPIPDVKSIEDKSFITAAQAALSEGSQGAAETPTYSSSSGVVVSRRPYNITFATGSATISPVSERVLNQLRDSLALSNGLQVAIDGYTDNTGNPEANRALSDARAHSVATWLGQHGIVAERLTHVIGHGQDNPVCPANNNAACKAQNRRVEIAQVE